MKKIPLILISIILIFFFVKPEITFSREAHWPFEKKEVENLLDIIRKEPLTEANFDLFYESLRGYEPNAPRQTGAIVLVKQTILKEQLDYWFKEVPKQLSIKFIKTALKIVPLIYGQDIGSIIQIIETFTVEKATNYALNWFLQNEIKIGSGEASYVFSSYKGSVQKIDIQYIIVYQALNQIQGKIVTEFYSKNPIEPPIGTAPDALAGNKDDPQATPWPWDRWKENEKQRDNDEKLEPFIVRIKGYVKRDRWGNFKWDENKEKPIVEVDFDNPVPEIEQSDVILKTGETAMKWYFFLEKVKDFISDKGKKTKDTTGNLIEKIKSYIFSLRFGAQIATQEIKEAHLSSLLLSNITELDIEKLTEEALSMEKVEEEAPAFAKAAAGKLAGREKARVSFAELIERFDDISEEADIFLAQAGQFLPKEEASSNSVNSGRSSRIDTKKEKKEGEGKGEKETEETKKDTKKEIKEELEEEPGEKFGEKPEKEPEDEIVFCSMSNYQTPTRNKVIFNEIAWMGTTNSANDEWLELKNVSGSSINLTGWQILDKDNQIKIVFENSTLSSGGFLLLERTDDNSASGTPADFIYAGALSNSNEALYLFDENCQLQDKIEANPYWPAGSNGSKKTMERKASLGWQTSSNIDGTPKIENSPGETYYAGGGGGTFTSEEPTSESSLSPKILITEVQIENTTSSYHDFIELYNFGTTTIDISGFQLKKKSSSGKEYSIRVFPAGSTISPQNYFLWTNSNYASSTQISADVTSTQTLAKNNSIALLDRDKNIIDQVAWGTSTNSFVENSSFPQNPDKNQSFGRKIDNNSNYLDTDDNSQDFEIQSPTPKAKKSKSPIITKPKPCCFLYLLSRKSSSWAKYHLRRRILIRPRRSNCFLSLGLWRWQLSHHRSSNNQPLFFNFEPVSNYPYCHR